MAEIALATGLVLRKLDRQAEQEAGDRDEVRDILRSSRVSRNRFRWLAPDQVTSRTNVFITMVVGGGILLSGLAWLLDKIAYPDDGLVPDDVTVLAQQLPDLDDPQLRVLLGRDR